MPDVTLENKVREELGLQLIAGLDEAGRGALAGPVVAAAVILPLDSPQRLQQLHAVNDSKQLTFRQREALYELIMEHALCWGVGSTAADEIDRSGIIAANAMAMEAALAQLQPSAQYLLIDGRMRLRNLPLPQQSVIRGDALSLSIAAASILAKVTRDRHMIALDAELPQYGFSQHKGYCTARHVAAIEKHGPRPTIHRFSFAPIRTPLL